MDLVDELHAVSRALSAAGISFAVCGGIAVTIHGATRTTKDIDLLPEGTIVVVSLASLQRMKRLAGRAQDLADLEKLETPDAD